MHLPSLRTFDRLETSPTGEWARALARSYLGLRLLIGALGVLLPLTLVAVDWVLLDSDEVIRGSMSAYYHSPARDLFVGGLVTSGITLVGYMFWKWRTWDFLLSFVGGLGVLAVAFFPTARPRPSGSQRGCDVTLDTMPPCTVLQERLGEETVRAVHLAATGLVVAAFTALCIVFALREFGYGRGARAVQRVVLCDRPPSPRVLGPMAVLGVLREDGLPLFGHLRRESPRSLLYLGCAAGVVVGGLWAVVGPTLPWLGGRELPHTYAGEFVAFSSFGMAWIVASWDLLRELLWLPAVVGRVGRSLDLDAGE